MTDLIPAWQDDRLQPVEKLRVHREGLRHKAVSVFVMRGGDVLLQQRAMGKYHTPGLWANTCCTHPGWDEPPADCAARRLDEEMGLSGLPLRWRAQVEYRADVGGGLTEHELVEVFLAEAAPGVEPRPNPAEVMATRWTDLAALRRDVDDRPDRYVPWLRIYLRQHGDAIFTTPPFRSAPDAAPQQPGHRLSRPAP